MVVEMVVYSREDGGVFWVMMEMELKEVEVIV